MALAPSWAAMFGGISMGADVKWPVMPTAVRTTLGAGGAPVAAEPDGPELPSKPELQLIAVMQKANNRLAIIKTRVINSLLPTLRVPNECSSRPVRRPRVSLPERDNMIGRDVSVSINMTARPEYAYAIGVCGRT